MTDLHLSPRTERHLAAELRTTGASPARPTTARRGTPISAERMGLTITAAVLATVLAVVALTVASGWMLIGALIVAAAGLVAVMATVARLTGQAEHVSPQLAADLEADGVADPDELFNDLLEQEQRTTAA